MTPNKRSPEKEGPHVCQDQDVAARGRLFLRGDRVYVSNKPAEFIFKFAVQDLPEDDGFRVQHMSEAEVGLHVRHDDGKPLSRLDAVLESVAGL